MITEDPLKYLCRDWFRPGAASNDEARNSEHLQRDGSGCLVVPWLSSPLINDLNCLRRTSLEELRQGAAMDEALLVQDKKKTSGEVSGKTSGKILARIRVNPHITIPELAAAIGVTGCSIEYNSYLATLRDMLLPKRLSKVSSVGITENLAQSTS